MYKLGGFFVIMFVFLLFIFQPAIADTVKEQHANLKKTVPDFSKLNPSCFVVDSASPIISMGSYFAGSNWNDPHVIKVGNQFVMYASVDTNFSKNIKIYRLVSDDGKNWILSPKTSVFERAQSVLAWDGKSVETPAVVFFNGQYYMFYTGYTEQEDPKTYGIGYATSPDGIAWKRQPKIWLPTNPNGAPDLNFMQYVVGEPAPVVFNGKIYLYFAAQGAHTAVNNTWFTIGLTNSSNGIDWSSPEEVLIPDQTVYPREVWRGYSAPHAIVMDTKIYLFFDVVKEPFQQEKIHYAVSPNGVSGWKIAEKAIFDKSQFPWTDHQINGASVLLDGETLYLWFAGVGNIEKFPDVSLGIGAAKCIL